MNGSKGPKPVFLYETLRLRFSKWRREGQLNRLVVEDDVFQLLQNWAERKGYTTEELADYLLRIGLRELAQNEITLQIWNTLSNREQQVVALICEGFSYRETGARLDISEQTVKSHLHNAYSKFGVRDQKYLRLLFKGWNFSDLF